MVTRNEAIIIMFQLTGWKIKPEEMCVWAEGGKMTRFLGKFFLSLSFHDEEEARETRVSN